MVDSQPDVNIRSRKQITNFGGWRVWQSDGLNNFSSTLTAEDRQTTKSEGHLWPPRSEVEKKRDIGGLFETEHFYTKAKPSGSNSERYSRGIWRYLDGAIWYPGDEPSIGSRPSNSQLDAWGTTAIARVDPTKSVVDMSVFLGELLREGIPSIIGAQSWKNRSEKARSAGSEYLNVQFGWVPLVSEIRSLARAVKNAESILKQYERDAGRLVRRRYDFPMERTVSKSEFQSYGVLSGYPELGTNRMVYRTDESFTKKWFSGAFTYWIPKGDSGYAKLRKYVDYADKLLGLELTPETLWNLAPWSWAVDWISNTGDVLHNVSAFDPDRLVMKYGYIMCHQEASILHSWLPVAFPGGKSSDGYWKAVKYRKIRRPATPYGFGLELGGLSDYQWSILVALGLTKGPRML
jgi:hypothetical protein